MESSYRIVEKSIRNSMFAEYLIAAGVEDYSIVKHDNSIFSGIDWFLKKTIGLSLKRIYNPYLRGYKGTYIVFDAMIDIDDLEHLRKYNPESRIVLMYWNSVESATISPGDVTEYEIETWSYSKKQCQKYGMKHNLLFFCDKMYEEALKNLNKQEYDIVFVGKDKGRLDIIEGFRNTYNDVKFKIHITANHFWQQYKNRQYKRPLSFSDMQIVQSHSKAIMEIVTNDEAELTFRYLDALILKKKLITNIKEARDINELPPEDIYIIGVDKPNSLREFLDKDYESFDDKVLQKYRFENWVNRIINNDPTYNLN